MNVKDRFFKAFEYLKEMGSVKNLQEFADIVGTNKAGMSDIKADRKKVSLENLTNLAIRFPEINISWIATGMGSMIFSYSEKATSNLSVKEPEQIIHRVPQVVTTDVDGRNTIVLVPVKAAAGYLNGYGDPEFVEKLPTYNLPNIQNGVFRMFQVNGHSMFPTLHNGSYVVGQFVENWVKDIKEDRVYVIVSRNDGIIVKRCLNRIKKYGSIYCKSDNRKEYPSFAVQPEDIIEVWECKGMLSFELPNPADLYDRVSDLEAQLYFLQNSINKKLN
ncbi:S24 family peptidase [Flavobacterium cerinum]|uniref:Helix-turn-helix transcriptional regulator n=1 Tax=Flavobacterium cerinum TaxID=2502784 RepID=A0A3S3Q9I3_9FLAO|nr:S24 family peptidase [Flavobacterium cerinum]RWX00955.1 helix-turn-helix transcriptional regulator [Flavobacterium cerinum]